MSKNDIVLNEFAYDQNGKMCFKVLRPKQPIELEYSKIEVLDMEIDTSDAPDFSDCYITAANYGDREMTQEELDVLNEDSAYVYSQIEKRLY